MTEPTTDKNLSAHDAANLHGLLNEFAKLNVALKVKNARTDEHSEAINALIEKANTILGHVLYSTTAEKIETTKLYDLTEKVGAELKEILNNAQAARIVAAPDKRDTANMLQILAHLKKIDKAVSPNQNRFYAAVKNTSAAALISAPLIGIGAYFSDVIKDTVSHYNPMTYFPLEQPDEINVEPLPANE